MQSTVSGYRINTCFDEAIYRQIQQILVPGKNTSNIKIGKGELMNILSEKVASHISNCEQLPIQITLVS